MSGLYVPNPVPRRSLKEQALWLKDVVAHYSELNKSGSSRFAQMSSAILRDGADVIAPDHPDFAMTLQAVKDLRELHFIWHVLEANPSDTSLWKKIITAFGDNVLPSDASRNSEARNTQFELFGRAILSRAGMRPIPLPNGADFRCDFGQWEFAVEVKRLTSIKKLRSCLSGAANQTHGTNLPGVLFVDYSEAVNPGDKLLAMTATVDHMDQAQQARHGAFWRRFGGQTRSAIKNKAILGIVFFDHLIIQNGLTSPDVGNWELATIRDNVKLVDHSRIDGVFDALNNVGLPSAVERG